MIKVIDLLEWINRNAMHKSIWYPAGWITGDDLSDLAARVKEHEPMDYAPVYPPKK